MKLSFQLTLYWDDPKNCYTVFQQKWGSKCKSDHGDNNKWVSVLALKEPTHCQAEGIWENKYHPSLTLGCHQLEDAS